MWVATTDEEANFIFDLLADRDATETMLAYARWLESRNQSRPAEFLRLELFPSENEDRLKDLRQELDQRWLVTVTSRRFRRGDVVCITAGLWQGIDATVVEVDARGAGAGLILNIFYRPVELTWMSFSDLRLQKSVAQEKLHK